VSLAEAEPVSLTAAEPVSLAEAEPVSLTIAGPMQVAVIGAGIAGLACAEALAAAGHGVAVFDKGRGPGGRMSTRRVDLAQGAVAFDHGAQYFTARDPDFAAQVQVWARAGLVAPWPAARADAWVGTPGMNAPLTALAKARGVRFSSHVMALVREDAHWHVALQGGVRHGPYDAVVVALPAEQAAAFLGAYDLMMAGAAMAARAQPCWTGMFAFAGRVPIADDVLRGVGALGWAARNSAKPGRGPGEAWVVQGDPAWSAARLEADAGEIAPLLLAALRGAGAGVWPEVVHAAAHRWRYARVAPAATGALWHAGLALGACGDWLLGPRVEAAWLSGRQLARRMIAPAPRVARRA